MNIIQARVKAREMLGPKAAVTDHGRSYAMPPWQRDKAQDELNDLRDAPRSSGALARRIELTSIISRRRYSVGVIERIGGIQTFRTLGRGDSWSEAFIVAADQMEHAA